MSLAVKYNFHKKRNEKNKNKKTLSHDQNVILYLTSKEQGTPLCTFRKASLTVEAAYALPVFALLAAAVLFLFRVLEVQYAVENAVEYAAREAAIAEHAEKEGMTEQMTLGIAEAAFQSKLLHAQIPLAYIENKTEGFSFADSKVSGAFVDLRVTYRIQNPIHCFGLFRYETKQRAKCRRWIGKTDENSNTGTMVYITESGTVYHLTKGCPYLELSIHAMAAAERTAIRNASGSRYVECERCKSRVSPDIVYITDYGTAYHSSVSCSGLKRTVYLVPLTQLNGYSPCSKCAKGEE